MSKSSGGIVKALVRAAKWGAVVTKRAAEAQDGWCGMSSGWGNGGEPGAMEMLVEPTGACR